MTTTKPRAAKAKRSTKASKVKGLEIDVQSAGITKIDTPALVVNLFAGLRNPPEQPARWTRPWVG